MIKVFNMASAGDINSCLSEEDVKAECKSSDQDDEDNGHCKEGEDDRLAEDDVFPNSVQEPHVKEEVDPGQGDGDRAELGFEAGDFVPDKAVAGGEDGKGVDEGVKEENKWELGSPPLDVLELTPDWLELPVEEEENYSCNIEKKKKPSESCIV